MGKDSNYNFIGWNGNSTINIETILENIVTLKKKTILPKVYIKYRKNKDVTYRSAKIKFDNIWSSLGRCLRIIYPEESANATLSGIMLVLEKNDSSIQQKFVVHFMDRKSGKSKIMIIQMIQRFL